MTDKQLLTSILDNDPAAIQDFFFVRCRDIFTYIGQYFCDGMTAEEIIGEAYEVLSADDWHKLRIFKGTCKLTTYVSVIVARYFQHKRDDRLQNAEDHILVKSGGKSENDSSVAFLLTDIREALNTLTPLDRTLIQRILLDGEKPGDVIDDVKDLIREELGDTFVEDHTPEKLSGYIYTRYSRVKTKFQNQMRSCGYGK